MLFVCVCLWVHACVSVCVCEIRGQALGFVCLLSGAIR